MPVIPGYDQKRNIEPRQSAPYRDEAAVPFQDSQKIINTMSNITQAWSDAHDTMQYTEARSAYEIVAADVMNRVKEDSDFKNPQKYIAELQAVKAKSIQNIDNKYVANRLAAELDHNLNINAINIQTNFRHKELLHNRLMLERGVNALISKKVFEYDSMTEAERMQADTDVKELIGMNLEKSTISLVDAEELLKNASLSEATATAQYFPERYIQNKDNYSLTELEKRNIEELAVKNARRIDIEAKKYQKKIQTENEVGLVGSILSGALLSVDDINKMIKEEKIQFEFGKAYINALSTYITDQEIAADKSGFLDYVVKLFESSDPEDIPIHVQNILNGGADGRVNQSELNALMKVAMYKYDEMQKKGNIFTNAMDAIANFFKRGEDENKR